MSESHPLISIKNLKSGYGERQILNGINLTINSGEIFVVMGGSGSGKSTLLKNMLGLHHPTAGEILVDGINTRHSDKADLTKLRKSTGVAFQGGALLSSLSVGDNIKLPLGHYQL